MLNAVQQECVVAENHGIAAFQSKFSTTSNHMKQISFFQTSVQALEEEGNAEKHQLAAMHQQRVLAHINQRKREAMTCYTQALTEQVPNVCIRYSCFHNYFYPL